MSMAGDYVGQFPATPDGAVLDVPAARRPIRELPDRLISQIAAGGWSAARPRWCASWWTTRWTPAPPRSWCASRPAASAASGRGRRLRHPAEPSCRWRCKRHATSKIGSLAELEIVATMGFRGEALAAINSGGRAEHRRAPLDAPHAHRLEARSGELAPAARATGTSVEVRELFFSTPARRKFLKTDATELAHCIEAVRRHALPAGRGFAVWHEGSGW